MHTELASERIRAALETLHQLTHASSQLPHEFQSTIQELTGSLNVALEETQAAHERLRFQEALLENASDAIITTDLDMTIRTWNKAAQTLYGFTAEEAIGRRVNELTQLEYPCDDEVNVLRAFSASGHWEGEIVQKRKDGRFLSVLASVSLIRESSGDAIGAVAINRDITLRKQVEDAIQESEEHFRTLTESLPIPLVITRPDSGKILYANRRYGETLGVPVSELIGRSELEFYARPVDRDAVLSRLSGGDALSTFEIQTKRADGSLFWARVSADTIQIGDERAVVTVFRDITEYVHLQQDREKLLAQADAAADARRTEGALLEAVLESTDAQIAYLDRDLDFVMVNTAYEKGCGYARDELIGRNHFELFPNQENQAIFERVRDTGEPIEFRAKPFVYPNRPELGTTYWDWTLTPLADSRGEVQGLVLSLMDVTEKERMLLQVEQERARLKAIIDTAPEAIVVVDGQCRIVMANPIADKLFVTPIPHGEAWVSYAWLNLCYPDGTPYEPRALPLTRSALDGEECRGVEMAILRPDGEQRAVLVSSAPIRDAKRIITGAVGVFQDITERKRTRDALQRAADRLRLLHDLDTILLTAPPLEQLAQSALERIPLMVPCVRASVSLFDLEDEQFTLLAVYSDGETQVTKGWRGPLKSLWYIEELRQGKVHLTEDLQLTTDPAPEWTLLRAEGIRSYASVPLLAEGTLLGSLNLGMGTAGGFSPDELEIASELAEQLAVAVDQDRLREQLRTHTENLEYLVEQRTAELQASEAQFRAIFESTAMGVALLDPQGLLRDTNPAFRAMLGYTEEELTHQPFTNLVLPSESGTEMNTYRGFLAGPDHHAARDARLVRSDGEVRWTHVTASVVRAHSGEPLYTIAVVEDTTEAKRTQEALIRAEKLAITGRLAASLAHEVNNPLQAVIGCLGLAQEAAAEGGAIDRYLEVGLDELRRAADVVARLRDIQRVSEPGQPMPIDLEGLLAKTDTLTRKRCQERAISASFHCAEELPLVRADEGRLQQVFLNLILNAADAMADGGDLHVVARETQDPHGVSIDFTDTGTGIDPDLMQRLFEPFVSTKEDGLGLGLYISQSIVQEYGGHIQANSEPGKGATFTVWMPS